MASSGKWKARKAIVRETMRREQVRQVAAKLLGQKPEPKSNGTGGWGFSRICGTTPPTGGK